MSLRRRSARSGTCSTSGPSTAARVACRAPGADAGGARAAARVGAGARAPSRSRPSTRSPTAPPASSGRSTRCAARRRARSGTGPRSWSSPTAASTPSSRPIPPLLATAAVHSHLVREGARTMCGLVVESGEPRETMHFALLLGYGAAAVCPYLALETLAEPAAGAASSRRLAPRPAQGLLEDGDLDRPELPRRPDLRGRRAGAGPGRALLPRHVSRVGGIELADLHADVRRSPRRGVHGAGRAGGTRWRSASEYRFRAGGERHAWDPEHDRATAARRPGRRPTRRSRAYAGEVDATRSLRGLLELVPAGPPRRRSTTSSRRPRSSAGSPPER